MHARVTTSVAFHSEENERLAEVCDMCQGLFVDLSNSCLLTSVGVSIFVPGKF